LNYNTASIKFKQFRKDKIHMDELQKMIKEINVEETLKSIDENIDFEELDKEWARNLEELDNLWSDNIRELSK
jgi:hypothetical protein